mgnify:CR=1 FL=1
MPLLEIMNIIAPSPSDLCVGRKCQDNVSMLFIRMYCLVFIFISIIRAMLDIDHLLKHLSPLLSLIGG